MSTFNYWFNSQPRVLRTIIAINVVLYVAWALITLFGVEVVEYFVARQLALDPTPSSVVMRPWQLLTYSFLHLSPGLGGLLHILFNMLWVLWIGREYEQTHGSDRMLALYLMGAIFGGVVSVLLAALFPGVGWFSGIIFGASGSVLAVMTAVAVLYPYQTVGLLFIGNIRLIYLVVASLVLDILVFRGSNAIGAHFGGALFGFLFAKAERAGLDIWSWAGYLIGGTGRRSRLKRVPREKERAGEKVEEKPRTASSSEVDRILDKISALGYEALTDEEKRTLYKAGER